MQSSGLATLHGKMHTGGMCKLPGGSTNLGPAEQNATHPPVENRPFGFASMLEPHGAGSCRYRLGLG